MFVTDKEGNLQFSTQPEVSPVILEGNWVYEPKRTLIQAGMARSGTCATAALIDAAGIPMGDSQDGHFERNLFHNSFDKPEVLRSEIGRLNALHDLWGLKCRVNGSMVQGLVDRTRNPCLLLVFRDAVAVSTRRKSIGDHCCMLDSVFEETECLKAMRYLRVPTMLVSFERLKADPRAFVRILSGLFRVDVDEEKAIKVINKGSGYILEYANRDSEGI